MRFPYLGRFHTAETAESGIDSALILISSLRASAYGGLTTNTVAAHAS